MLSVGRTVKKPHDCREKAGWVLLMYDSPLFSGLDECSLNAFFFEMTWDEFIREIREDVDSFFGYLDESTDYIDAKKSMWEKLHNEKEYSEGERRVVLVQGTARVK